MTIAQANPGPASKGFRLPAGCPKFGRYDYRKRVSAETGSRTRSGWSWSPGRQTSFRQSPGCQDSCCRPGSTEDSTQSKAMRACRSYRAYPPRSDLSLAWVGRLPPRPAASVRTARMPSPRVAATCWSSAPMQAGRSDTRTASRRPSTFRPSPGRTSSPSYFPSPQEHWGRHGGVPFRPRRTGRALPRSGIASPKPRESIGLPKPRQE
jgi:hypothetical protein